MENILFGWEYIWIFSLLLFYTFEVLDLGFGKGPKTKTPTDWDKRKKSAL